MSVNRLCSRIYFSEELIIDILKRLPVKSLLRFMSVCKLWYSLIKSPNVITLHFNHHINEGPKYLMYCINNDEYRVYEDNDTLDWHLEFREPGIRYSIVGCCNGIICLGSYRDKPIVLWNSSLRKSLEIQVPHCTTVSDDEDEDEDEDREKFFYWFGFDVASNDYKVMWVRYSTDDNLDTRSLGVYIYSLNERTWRCVDSSFEYYDGEGYEFGDRGEYMDGVIHWVARTCKVDREMPESVLIFNLADEKFNMFNLPSEIEYVEQIFDYPLDFEDFIKTPLLFDNVDLQIVKRGSKNCLVAWHEDLTSTSLWVLEHDGIEGVWSLEFCSSNVCVKKILNVRANGKIVVQLKSGIVISSDYDCGGFEVVSSEEKDYVGNYMESLVFL